MQLFAKVPWTKKIEPIQSSELFKVPSLLETSKWDFSWRNHSEQSSWGPIHSGSRVQLQWPLQNYLHLSSPHMFQTLQIESPKQGKDH